MSRGKRSFEQRIEARTRFDVVSLHLSEADHLLSEANDIHDIKDRYGVFHTSLVVLFLVSVLQRLRGRAHDDRMPICRRSAWGQSRKSPSARVTSALPSTPDLN